MIGYLLSSIKPGMMKKSLPILVAVLLIVSLSSQLIAQETPVPKSSVDTLNHKMAPAFLKLYNQNTKQVASDTLISVQSEPQQHDSANPKEKKQKNRTFSPGWALGIKASSFGPGIEIVKSFTEVFSIRLGGTYMKLDYEMGLEDALSVGDQGTITTGSVSLLGDFNFLSFMHFTGGIIYNMNTLDLYSEATDDYYVGEIQVDPQTLGSLTYSLTPNAVCPYVALGFGRSISRYRIVSFTFEAGLIYQGPPKVGLEATGMLSPTANYAQQKLLESNVQNFTIYPVVNFQLSFRVK